MRTLTFRGSKTCGGFTLVELLVVLTIIAVLAAVLLAAISAVRERSDATQCVANLRQLAIANVTYTADNGGRYVQAQERTNTIRWHGARGSVKSKFDPRKGPLAPYLGKDGRVKLCPSLRTVLREGESFEDGTGGYGYNAIYIGGTPADRYSAELVSNVPRAARTVMFSDTAFPRGNGLQEYAYCEPWEWVDRLGRPSGALAPSVHFRHNGYANVAWCDGRVTPEPPTALGGKNRYGGDASKWLVGWFGPREDNGFWRP